MCTAPMHTEEQNLQRTILPWTGIFFLFSNCYSVKAFELNCCAVTCSQALKCKAFCSPGLNLSQEVSIFSFRHVIPDNIKPSHLRPRNKPRKKRVTTTEISTFRNISFHHLCDHFGPNSCLLVCLFGSKRGSKYKKERHKGFFVVNS